jgi:hypothetical protein
MLTNNMIIVLGILLPLIWNVSIVSYLIYGIRKRTLTALKFSVVFVLSLGLTISMILLVAATAKDGFSLTLLGIVLLVLGIHAVVVLPIVYYLSKTILMKKFRKLGDP